MTFRVGQRYQHRREKFRIVEITELREDRFGGGAFVKRNTSRRTQAISAATFRKNYKLISEPGERR